MNPFRMVVDFFKAAFQTAVMESTAEARSEDVVKKLTGGTTTPALPAATVEVSTEPTPEAPKPKKNQPTRG